MYSNKLFWILVFGGIIIIAIGASKIIYPEALEFFLGENALSKPIPQLLPLPAIIPENSTSYKKINVNFRAWDVFSAGYPVDYIFDIEKKRLLGIGMLFKYGK